MESSGIAASCALPTALVVAITAPRLSSHCFCRLHVVGDLRLDLLRRLGDGPHLVNQCADVLVRGKVLAFLQVGTEIGATPGAGERQEEREQRSEEHTSELQ